MAKGKCSRCQLKAPSGKSAYCTPCQRELYQERKAKAGDKPKASPVAAAAAAIAELVIEQGYGLKAHVEDEYLMIEQSDGEGKTDAICLSRTEMRHLVNRFGTWMQQS